MKKTRKNVINYHQLKCTFLLFLLIILSKSTFNMWVTIQRTEKYPVIPTSYHTVSGWQTGPQLSWWKPQILTLSTLNLVKWNSYFYFSIFTELDFVGKRSDLEINRRALVLSKVTKHFLRAPRVLRALTLWVMGLCKNTLERKKSLAVVRLQKYYKNKALSETVLTQPVGRCNLESIIQSERTQRRTVLSLEVKGSELSHPILIRVLRISACVSFTIPMKVRTFALATLFQKRSLVLIPHLIFFLSCSGEIPLEMSLNCLGSRAPSFYHLTMYLCTLLILSAAYLKPYNDLLPCCQDKLQTPKTGKATPRPGTILTCLSCSTLGIQRHLQFSNTPCPFSLLRFAHIVILHVRRTRELPSLWVESIR